MAKGNAPYHFEFEREQANFDEFEIFIFSLFLFLLFPICRRLLICQINIIMNWQGCTLNY